MSNNINYDIYTVSAGGNQGAVNTLAKIADEKQLDKEILFRLNPDYTSYHVFSAGNKVLIGVGSMTGKVDGFVTSTIRFGVNKTQVYYYYVEGATRDNSNGSFNERKDVESQVVNHEYISKYTLTSLVEELNSTYELNLEIGTVLQLNPNISQSAYIKPGTTILLSVSAPGAGTTVKISEFGILVDTTRTLFVAWEWNEKVNKSTEKYEIEWQWQTSSGTWITGSKTTTSDAETKQATYSPDEKAIAVRVRVKPTTKSGTNTSEEYKWTDWQTHSFGYSAVITPPTPSVEIKNYKLTATLDGISMEANNISHAEFEIVQDNKAVPYKSSDKLPLSTGYVSYTCDIAAGHNYKVRARCYNSIYDIYSSWSSYSNISNTLPTAPELKECKVLSNNVVQFTWSKVESAAGYILEYALKDEYYKEYGSAEEYLNNPGINKDTVQIEATNAFESNNDIIHKAPNMSYGDYLVRVKAIGDGSTESKWSIILGFTLGKESDAPTTWSSTTTAKIGEPLRLYWIHNATDGSEETSAEIQIVFNDDNHDDDTSVITVTKTTDNTIKKIAQSTKQAAYLIKAYNSSLSGFSDDDAIEPGTLVLISPGKNSKYLFVKSEDEDLTSFFEINTELYLEGAKIDWQVRTAGILTNSDGTPVYGDWSIERTVDIYAPPTLQVAVLDYQHNVLDDRLTTFPFYITLTPGNTANQKPTGYYVSVIAVNDYTTVDQLGNDVSVVAGSKIFSKYYNAELNTESFEVQITPKDLTLETSQTYKVVCSVAMSSGLTAETESTPFYISWSARTRTPNAEVGLDRNTLSAIIRPFCNGAGDTVTLHVYRREFDGTFTPIISESDDINDGLENTEQTYVTDPHPALDYARYRIVARSKTTGAISYNDIPGYPVNEKSVVIQWDETWQNFDAIDGDAMVEKPWNGSMIKIPYNIDVSNSHSPDVSLIRYIGRKRPVSYYGTQLGETATWNVVIPKSDKETLYALRRLAIYMGNVYVREPSGSGYWANITISFSQKHLDLTIPVTINVTPVEGGI